MKILVDHTSFHTLSAGPHQSSSDRATLGVLQLLEELLLAETVWIADTEGTRTLAGTYNVIDALQNARLALPTNTGLVRIAHFSPASFMDVIERASSSLSNVLVLQGSPHTLAHELRERGRVDAGPLKPAGVLPVDFHRFVKRVGKWSSNNRAELLQEILVDREFNSTLSPFLCSKSLFDWLVACVVMVPNKEDPIYTHLMTLARLSINRSLAESISRESNAAVPQLSVTYAPAYARAKALATNYLTPAAAGLYFLREKLAELYGEGYKYRLNGAIPYSSGFRMPVLGAWLMLSLPRDATLPDYLEEVAQQREASAFVAFRKWLAGQPTSDEVEILVNKVQRRLKVPKTSPSRTTAWFELSMTRRPNIGIKRERDVPGIANLPLTRIVRTMRTGGTVALLTGCLEKILQDASIANDLVARTEHLLASSRGLTSTSSRRRRRRGGASR